MVNFEERIKNLSDRQKMLLAKNLSVKSEKHDSSEKNQRLVAYLVKKEGLNKEGLREFLKEKLPDYMIPGNFVELESFPKLPNGKIDLNSLSLPKESDSVDSGYIAPRTEIEKQLTAIWEEVLDFEPIGINDNFFEIGGDSILSIQIIAKAQKKDIKLTPAQILQYPTIRELVEVVQDKEEEQNLTSLVPIRASGSKPPIFCMHAGGGHVLFYKTLTNYLHKDQPVYGIQPRGLDSLELPHNSVEEMATHYLTEIKKLRPEGPYLIVGYCFSNAVCIEMATQLEQMGESNFKVIIVDAHPMNMPFDKSLMPTFGEKLHSYHLLIKQKNWKEVFQRLFYKLFAAGVKVEDVIYDKMDKVNKHGENLQNIQKALKKVFIDYEWKPFNFKVTLILAGDFETHPWARTVIARWKTLALNGVDYHFIPGSHMSLFDEPDVQELGKKLQQILDENPEK